MQSKASLKLDYSQEIKIKPEISPLQHQQQLFPDV
jgi:hypothetical protein